MPCVAQFRGIQGQGFRRLPRLSVRTEELVLVHFDSHSTVKKEKVGVGDSMEHLHGSAVCTGSLRMNKSSVWERTSLLLCSLFL